VNKGKETTGFRRVPKRSRGIEFNDVRYPDPEFFLQRPERELRAEKLRAGRSSTATHEVSEERRSLPWAFLPMSECDTSRTIIKARKPIKAKHLYTNK